jgi:hypothetical protein
MIKNACNDAGECAVGRSYKFICTQFNGIIGDLFPGLTLPPPDYAAMHAALIDACDMLNLQPTDYFLLKARPAATYFTVCQTFRQIAFRPLCL